MHENRFGISLMHFQTTISFKKKNNWRRLWQMCLAMAKWQSYPWLNTRAPSSLVRSPSKLSIEAQLRVSSTDVAEVCHIFFYLIILFISIIKLVVIFTFLYYFICFSWDIFQLTYQNECIKNWIERNSLLWLCFYYMSSTSNRGVIVLFVDCIWSMLVNIICKMSTLYTHETLIYL